MKTYLINDEVQAKVVEKQILEAPDYETCLELSIKYYDKVYPSCNEAIRTRLFDFCFENGVIIFERAHRFSHLCGETGISGKKDIRYEYFLGVFHGFGLAGNREVYNKKSDTEKRKYLVEETELYFKHLTKFYNAMYTYLYISDKFPELKSLMIDVLYSLCYDEKGLWPPYGSDFVTIAGVNHPYSKKILNSYLFRTIKGFVSSAVICVGSIIVASKAASGDWSIPGWTVFILIPCMLGFGLRGIQYFFKIFVALANYGRESGFKFDTGVFAYTRVGHYEKTGTPLKKR